MNSDFMFQRLVFYPESVNLSRLCYTYGARSVCLTHSHIENFSELFFKKSFLKKKDRFYFNKGMVAVCIHAM